MTLKRADPASRLHTVVERMQLARCGSPQIDALVKEALAATRQAKPTGPAGLSWSTDLRAALALLPDDHNFSVGRRDGVCWAWIQPNALWAPAEHEARHDHPAGSGLIVAHTAALAFTSAAIMLLVQRLENMQRRPEGPRLPDDPHGCGDSESLSPTPAPNAWHTTTA